jgi:hypothetical protein
MATSILTGGGIVEFPATLYGTDDDPVDTVVMRDGVMHGLLHAADSMGQVRVNYMGIGNAVSEGQDEFETIETPANTSDYYLMGGTPFGPWPLTMRANGEPYKLRVRVGGSVSATPATATFRIVIAPLTIVTAADVLAALDSTLQVTATSTTLAWLTGQSQGTLGSTTLITVTADQAAAWTRDVDIYNAVSSPAGGQTVEQIRVMAYVFAKTSDVTKLPQLSALHIQEYIGA